MADESAAKSGWAGTATNFLVGTVLAGLVSTAFTYKSWREQTRLDLAKQQLADASVVFDKGSALMAARIFSSYDVVRHIGDTDETFAKRQDKLEKAIEDWNLSYADVLQRFQFALEIDEDGNLRPYREVRTSTFADHLDCAKAFDDSNRPAHADWSRPSWVLAGVNYCFVHTNIFKKSQDLAKLKATPERYAAIVDMDRQIDDLQTHCEEARVAGKQAIQRLRRGVEARSFFEFLRGW